MNLIRWLFGFHIHTWGDWFPIYASDLTEAGRKRMCIACSKEDFEMYPDGH